MNSPAKPAAQRPFKLSRLLILLLLIVAALSLSGCGVPIGGVDVQNVAPVGWWQTIVVWPLARLLIWLDSVLAGWGIPYHWGFTIILFTLVMKIVTFPLTYTQLKGMQAQRAIQPKVQELQKKYGNDRNRLAQEQMKLYQEAGVSPLGGCLPLLIQMPILFGLYAALVAIGPNLTNARFFWIPDLGFPHARVGMGWLMDFWRQGDYLLLIAYLILPVLLMVTQFVMQKWMTPTPVSDDPQMKSTQQITLVMTFMFGFFTLQVPSGLTLYWVTSNLLQMAQQWYMMRNTTLYAAPATTNGKAGETKVIDGKAEVKGNGGAVAQPATKSAAVVAKPTTVKSTAAKESGSAKRKGSK